MLNRTEPEAVGMSTARLQRITPWMTRYVESGRLPGCLTAVMRNGAIAYLNCCGMADPQSSRRVGEESATRR